MAILKHGLTIFVLLATLIILETDNFVEFSSPALPVHPEEQHILPHTREKRSALPGQWNYTIDVVVNASDVETFEQFWSSLNATSFPIQLDNKTNISDISITTVCSSTGAGFQCRCEEQFAWPYSICVSYGACDYISGGACKCINAIPDDGQVCQPISALLGEVEYTVDVELNVTDLQTVDYLRSLLKNGSFSLTLGPTLNVTHIDLTTVCYPNGTNYQCRCEDQYVWSYRNCSTYGACDEITNDTCGCINSIPSDGRYCQPKKVPPVVYEYQIFIEVNTTDVDRLRNTLTNISFPIQLGLQVNISAADITTVCSTDGSEFQCRCEDHYLWPCDKCATYGKCDGDTSSTCGCIKALPTDGQICQSVRHQNFSVCPTTTPSTAPPVLYEYLISVELNVSDAALINQLRTILSNISFPISISDHTQISDISISTVCSLSSGGSQCRCEDQYRWSCDQCFLYGSCDSIINNTCGCINAIPPDRQYCKSADQHNFTTCPLTTTPSPTTPPVLYEYLISVELNVSDAALINQLRTILSNISFPISISDHTQISDISISTVCSLSSGGSQCRCEDQYRWSCDQCFLYGSCDSIINNTCGCINAIPPDRQYCKSADQHNFTTCPLTTTPSPTTPPVLYEYLISVELNVSDAALINQLRTILSNISFPISISEHTQISDISISTVCSLSSGGSQCRCEDQYRWSCDQCFLYGSCDSIINNTCGCINAIPPDRQYCKSADQHNFTTCPLTTTPSPTTPPVLYEYLISVELNVSDAALINQLRTILSNISFPISISDHTQISDISISTVCSLSSGGSQCRCEDQYRWSCDQCFLYGSCDSIINNTCGCINAIPPDRQYCKSADQHNFTTCPLTTTPSPTTPPVLYEYLISVELNVSDAALINQLRTILSNISFPISISDHTQISDISISTVCSLSSGGSQCRCEDQYRWSCDQCFLYGSCDSIINNTCGCINAIPPDRQYCKSADQHNFTTCPLTTTPSPTTPPVLYEYLISVELNVSDAALINQLRTILSNISFPISISDHTQISDISISTVCSLSSGGSQCRCEDQYRWSCDQCFLYGSCDGIINNTCGCINAIPPDRQYCKSADQHNFTTCPLTTTPSPTTPPVLYEYLISVELNVSDAALINQLRTILSNISFPISISEHTQISDISISTVCSLSSGGSQCRCEDQYRWSCDQCLLYGSCDGIINNTCGCINAIPPDRQYCKSADQHNFTTCPLTTTPSPTTPPVLYEYLISVELNVSDAALINQLRTILSNISFPVSISDHTQISSINISTVCYPNGTTYHCRCEEQYRWPCHMCSTFGKCDDMFDNTCGCINAIPPDGPYCQTPPELFICPSPAPPNDTTTVPTTQYTTLLTATPTIRTDTTRVDTTDLYTTRPATAVTNSTPAATTDGNTTVVITTPSTVTDTTPAGTTDLNTTTPAVVTTSTPVATTDLNTTSATTTPMTAVTNSTPAATTDGNATTAATPTTFVTNSTPVATTDVNTTTSATPPTAVTNSTPGPATHLDTSAPLTSQTAVVTNSTPVATTDMNTTTAATPTVIVTNSTPGPTTHLDTSAPFTSPTAVVTNSTPVATTHLNTTTTISVTTTPATLSPTYSTTVATTDVNTTTVTTTPTTVVTNSTSTATTHQNTITALTSATVTKSTPVDVNTTAAAPSTTVIDSTTVATTDVNTTPPTTNVTTTSVSSQNTTVSSATSEVTAIPISTTAFTTTATNPTTTAAEVITTVPTTSTTGDTTAIPTTNTTGVTTAIPTTNTTGVTTAIPTTNTTGITTAIPTTNTTGITTAIPTTNTTGITTAIPTTNTTRVTTAIPTTSTTRVTTAIPTTTAARVITTVPTTSTTGVTTTIPTTTTARVITTVPTTTTTRATTTMPTTTAARVITTAPTTTTTRATTTTTSTTATSTLSTTRATTTTPEVIIPPTGFDVEMSIRLDLEYTAELNDATSSEYKDLESKVHTVLQQQYKGITGFINVFVKAFREGSVITDFVVQTTEVIVDEMADANEKLKEAMRPIAPVIGSVTAFYNSSTPIPLSGLIYTGNTMTLTCGPPKNITLGQISASVWKFKGLEIKNSGRIKITASGTKSILTVNNVILADIGLYECTLRGKVMNFLQTRLVTGDNIKQAPIVRLQSKVNVKCKVGQIQQLQCCVQSSYRIKWFQGTTKLSSAVTDDGETYCIKHDYQLESCSGSQQNEISFTCKVDEPEGYQMTTTVIIFNDDITCDDAEYGTGRTNDISRIGCGKGQEGSKTAVCQETGEWRLMTDSCIITQIKELLIDSQDLVVEEVPQFAANLSKTVQENKTEIANSSATISAIVEILNTIANVTTAVGESVMQNVLITIDVIIGDDTRESWAVLNANETHSASSGLLDSLESIAEDLVGEFAIETPRILLNRTKFDNSFTADLNSSIIINIPPTTVSNVFITTITFPTLNIVMPARNSSFDVSLLNSTSNETVIDDAINAAVVLVQVNATIQNVTLSFDKLNNSLSLNPQCVFWNFTLFGNLGAWDDEGCTFVSDINNTVTCSCNHLTSFSVLMATDIPQELRNALDVITYVGVGISMASLVICLIIEGYVWKAITRNSTAFMRHLSIINTALSLLIADICFIIGASIAKNPLENPGEDYKVPVGPCSTATFFMHFFYLALFFWMLVSGLLLFYRTVMVFSHMSKSTMLAIGFSLGYGCPLIIAVITVAVTAPGNGYTRTHNACWLNWVETKALLALVIPALTIVFINILIVIVVLFKMLRRGVGDSAQTDERHTLVVIARCVIILTPLFGLTWSLGVGTMVSSTNKGIHIAFAFFNSLQGFFILVFGTLLDSKIRSILSRRSATSSTGSNPTRSTSGGISSLSELNWISRLRRRRYVYRLSEAANSSSTGASESFVSI
ncbi:uncharacterized threonine-rich GPI-anchored glycoprotein PJ4664.02-like isoform X3 [Chelmon rostratus]|uniref:uncharacterized threonine-rich GPI-anchored glycoprotein PJ4664.02-like isoform X3 n=1 Tax=Chelmon rostratus TaxID=109905 RepID=UPI001BE627E6|nr:uncharacterized threonine-rich GPI-anchored glycoprotein PJ4664.02-like isoform X3 [Chelmon rostratus]